MEKEKILSTLTEKLGKTGLSAKTLETYVKNNMPAEGAEPDDSYWGTHVGFLQSLGGQYNHDVAKAVEEAKKNFTPDPGKSNKKDNGSPEEEDPVLKRIEALEKMLADEKKKSSVASVRTKVSGMADELKVSNKALWNDAVNMTDVAEEMDEASFTGMVKSVYEEKLKAYMGEGAVPYNVVAPAGAGDREYEKELDDFFSRKAKEGKFPEKK